MFSPSLWLLSEYRHPDAGSSLARIVVNSQEMQYCRSVILSVVDEIGIRTTMDELLSATTSSNPKLRYAAVTILHVFCDQSKADYSEYIPQLIRALIHMSVDDNVLVLSVSWDCLNSVTKVSV